MSRRKDFRKKQPESPLDGIFEKYGKVESQGKDKKVKLNENEIELEGKVFVIKSMKHLDCLATIPSFLNTWYAHLAIMGVNKGLEEEGMYDENSFTTAELTMLFFKRLEDIEFVAHLEDILSNVSLKGVNTPIDIDKDLKDTSNVLRLFREVVRVNFLMSLCQTILMMPQTMMIQVGEETLV